MRALIVDDSRSIRSYLRLLLEKQGLECVEAGDGQLALVEIQQGGSCDLALVDVNMPVMGGLECVKAMRRNPEAGSMKIIMVTSEADHALIQAALDAGADEYLMKPFDAAALIGKLRMIGIARLSATGTSRAIETPHHKQPEIVVIGVSTGGPAALQSLLPMLPADFPVPIVIVQHMPQLFTALLAERLNRECALAVREAAPAMLPEPGTVSIARGDWHLEFEPVPVMLRLFQAPSEQHCRPSVDMLFRSAAQIFGDGVLGVVLTGMGSDGLEGCRAIRSAGGRILVQDRASSSVWGMPGVVAEAGLAHRILPLSAIAVELIHLCQLPSTVAATKG